MDITTLPIGSLSASKESTIGSEAPASEFPGLFKAIAARMSADNASPMPGSKADSPTPDPAVPLKPGSSSRLLAALADAIGHPATAGPAATLSHEIPDPAGEGREPPVEGPEVQAALSTPPAIPVPATPAEENRTAPHTTAGTGRIEGEPQAIPATGSPEPAIKAAPTTSPDPRGLVDPDQVNQQGLARAQAGDKGTDRPTASPPPGAQGVQATPAAEATGAFPPGTAQAGAAPITNRDSDDFRPTAGGPLAGTGADPAGQQEASRGPSRPALPAPVASSAWQQQLGQQMLGLARRGESQMELRLHPAELGPLTVSLRVDDNNAQAQFFSSHGQVRQAVEQALPQLREALAEQGIELGETSVGDQSPQRQDDFPGGQPTARDRKPGNEVTGGDTNAGGAAGQAPESGLPGGVDLYA